MKNVHTGYEELFEHSQESGSHFFDISFGLHCMTQRCEAEANMIACERNQNISDARTKRVVCVFMSHFLVSSLTQPADDLCQSFRFGVMMSNTAVYVERLQSAEAVGIAQRQIHQQSLVGWTTKEQCCQ